MSREFINGRMGGHGQFLQSRMLHQGQDLTLHRLEHYGWGTLGLIPCVVFSESAGGHPQKPVFTLI